MRTISAIVLTSAATLTLAACGSAQRADSGATSRDEPAPTTAASPVDYSRDVAPMQASGATLTVRGLSCPKCANNVTKQLEAVPGVSTVSVHMGDGLVDVSFIDGLHPSRAQLAQAIDRSGFTLVEINAR